jgi:hypothetical protein
MMRFSFTPDAAFDIDEISNYLQGLRKFRLSASEENFNKPSQILHASQAWDGSTSD